MKFKFHTGLFCLLVPVLFLIWLGGCSSKAVKHEVSEVPAQPQKVKTQKVHHSPIEDHIDARAYHYYINGLLSEEMGELPQAAESYEKALQFYPKSYQIGFSLAKILYQTYRPERALEVLKEMYPRDAEVYRLSGACFHMLGKFDDARASYLNLVKLKPDDIDSYANLAEYYESKRDIDSTIWAYQKLAEYRFDDYRVWQQLGRFQAQKGSYKEASESFSKSLELNNTGSNFLSYIGLGETLEYQNKHDSSLATYKEGLERDPTNPLFLKLLVNVYLQNDNFEEALPYSKELVKLVPDEPEEKFRLGQIYFRLDSLDAAENIFSEFVKDGSPFSMQHYYLGMIAMVQEKWDKARNEFLFLTQKADTLYFAWLNLGYVYSKLDQPQKEIETYRKGLNNIKSEEGVDRLLFALGAAYEREKDYPKAVETFELLIQHFPDNSQALNYLGYMLADRNEQLDYAKELIDKALRLDPDNAAFLDSYGWVSFRLGHFDKALEYLKKAVELDTDPIIFDHLGDAYQAVGDMENAKIWWEKALEEDPENENIREKLSP